MPSLYIVSHVDEERLEGISVHPSLVCSRHFIAVFNEPIHTSAVLLVIAIIIRGYLYSYKSIVTYKPCKICRKTASITVGCGIHSFTEDSMPLVARMQDVGWLCKKQAIFWNPMKLLMLAQIYLCSNFSKESFRYKMCQLIKSLEAVDYWVVADEDLGDVSRLSLPNEELGGHSHMTSVIKGREGGWPKRDEGGGGKKSQNFADVICERSLAIVRTSNNVSAKEVRLLDVGGGVTVAAVSPVVVVAGQGGDRRRRRFTRLHCTKLRVTRVWKLGPFRIPAERTLLIPNVFQSHLILHTGHWILIVFVAVTASTATISGRIWYIIYLSTFYPFFLTNLSNIIFVLFDRSSNYEIFLEFTARLLQALHNSLPP